MTTRQPAAPAQPQGWLDVAEKGSVFGIRVFVWFVTVFGRPAGRAVLAVVMLYYAVFGRTARRASRTFLEHLDIVPTFSRVYQHLLRFGQVTLDRVFFVRGDIHLFDIERNGSHHLESRLANNEGAILLGAHMGSFEAMRARAERADFPINVIGNFRNARMINAVLRSLNPDAHVRFMDLAGGRLDVLLDAKERVDRGEFVALLGDRVTKGDRSAVVDFLGAKARFPTGPYLLAATLKCPIYLTVGVYRGGNRYTFFCEEFAEQVKLPRKGKEEALAAYAQQYADRIAEKCRMAPENWFNFYDFWEVS